MICLDRYLLAITVYISIANRTYYTVFLCVSIKAFHSHSHSHITDHSATLIDNIFGNRIDNNESGIILNNISDHQMMYTYSTEQIPCRAQEKQYVQFETKDAQAMNKFIHKLHDLKIADNLNKDVNADPNDNFKQFIDIFANLKICQRERLNYIKENIKSNRG